MKKVYSAYLQLTLGMFLAGSTVVAGKYIVNLPIAVSQTISLFFAILVLWPAAHLKEGSIVKIEMKKKDFFLIFMQAFTGLFLFRIFMLLGLRWTTGIASGIVMSTTPIILAILGWLMLKERLSLPALMGILIGTGGIAFINTANLKLDHQGQLISFLGNGCILLAVIGEALFTIFRKKQSFNNRPITVSAIIMVMAFLLFLPWAVFELKDFSISLIGKKEGLALIYYGVFGSAAAYICWLSGIAKVKISTAAGFSGVMPLSSVVLSVFLLGEVMVWQYAVGMFMTLLGIYLLMIKESPENACKNENEVKV